MNKLTIILLTLSINIFSQNLYIFEGDTFPLEKKFSQYQLDSICQARCHIDAKLIRLADIVHFEGCENRTHYKHLPDKTIVIRYNDCMKKRFRCLCCGRWIKQFLNDTLIYEF